MMSDYANVPAEPVHRQKPEVRGSLLYFCIVLTILAPAKIIQPLTEASSPFLIAIYGTLALTSFLAGVTTWATLNSAFVFIRIHLVARLLYAAFQIWIVAHLSQRQADSGEEIISMAGDIAGLLLIFLYFRISSRVNETFGRNI
jgi:hypothetical protein